MTKNELQAAIVSEIKYCDKVLDHNKKSYEDWVYVLGQQNGFKLALKLVEDLYDVRADTAREIVKKYKEAFEVIREEGEINKTAFDFLYDDISDEILNDYGEDI